jgi:hypothetical protein
MPGQRFIDAWIDHMVEEAIKDDHEREQRMLALAYADANKLPPPEFPLERVLPEERPPRKSCPCCGYDLGTG